MNFLKKVFPLSFNMIKDTKSFVWGIIINAAIWAIAPIIVVVPLILAGAFMCIAGILGAGLFYIGTVMFSFGILTIPGLFWLIPLVVIGFVIFLLFAIAMVALSAIISLYGMAGLVFIILAYTKVIK